MKDKAIRDFFCDSCCLQWIKPEPHNEKLFQQIEEENQVLELKSKKMGQVIKPISPVSSNQSGGIPKMSDINNKSNNQKKKLPICFICDKEISRKNSFTENDELLHENIKAEMKIKVNKCTKCGKSFTTIKTLKRHIKSLHEGKKPYDCD